MYTHMMADQRLTELIPSYLCTHPAKNSNASAHQESHHLKHTSERQMPRAVRKMGKRKDFTSRQPAEAHERAINIT